MARKRAGLVPWGPTVYDGGMSPLSGVLSEAWTLYRRHAPHFIAISFVISLVVAVITALLSWALGTIGAFIGVIFSLFGMFLLQAALVKAVQDARDGRTDLSLGETVSAVMPFVPPGYGAPPEGYGPSGGAQDA